MRVKTGGPIRGFIGRWIFRFEAAGQILRIVFQGTTAVSALSGVLAYVGYRELVPVVLALGFLGVCGFAYLYEKLGVFNRKNRERVDRGDNFAGPGMAMTSLIQSRIFAEAMAAARNGATDEEIAERVDRATKDRLRQFRDGIDLAEIYGDGRQEVAHEGA